MSSTRDFERETSHSGSSSSKPGFLDSLAIVGLPATTHIIYLNIIYLELRLKAEDLRFYILSVAIW